MGKQQVQLHIQQLVNLKVMNTRIPELKHTSMVMLIQYLHGVRLILIKKYHILVLQHSPVLNANKKQP